MRSDGIVFPVSSNVHITILVAVPALWLSMHATKIRSQADDRDAVAVLMMSGDIIMSLQRCCRQLHYCPSVSQSHKLVGSTSY